MWVDVLYFNNNNNNNNNNNKNLSQEGVTCRLWFSLQMFSKKSLFWEVLEPLLWWNLFFNLGGWDELKCVYWNVSVGLKCVRISRTESFRESFAFSNCCIWECCFCLRDFSHECSCWVVTVGLFNELWYFYSVHSPEWKYVVYISFPNEWSKCALAENVFLPYSWRC